MTNEALLQKYVDAFMLIGNERIIIIGDLNLKFIYVSKSYLQIMGQLDILGKQMKDTNLPGVEYANQLKKISEKVLATGKKATFFIVYRFPHESSKSCYLYRVSPIIHPETKQPIGLIGELELFNCKYLGQAFKLTAQLVRIETLPSGLTKQPFGDYVLSPREEEVLFLLMLGHTHKKIANIINSVQEKQITTSAVNAVIRRLFTKFDVISITDLLIKVSGSNLLEKIPASLLTSREGIFEIDYHY